jgi:hypothetical protein
MTAARAGPNSHRERRANAARRSSRFIAQSPPLRGFTKEMGLVDFVVLETACQTLRDALPRKTSGARRRFAAGSKVRGRPPLRPCCGPKNENPPVRKTPEGSLPISSEPSPSHRTLGIRLGATPCGQSNFNMHPQRLWPKGDISTLQKGVTFLFCVDRGGIGLDRGGRKRNELHRWRLEERRLSRRE